ncbi:hypothetical protein [Kitasatospora viridis]|uniref:hypothetical protein n=1 Tax=Kitasatospora viridis TaxID=281105 RepID=UPI001FE4D6A1|nr:hypothetical protein [Kitasatospora viridis]
MPGCSTATTGRPATSPAKATTPAIAARTGSPGAAARSTPRCPAAHGCGGGLNRRSSAPGPPTGHTRPGGPIAAAAPATPTEAARSAATDSTAVTSSTRGITTTQRPPRRPATGRRPGARDS